MLFVVGSAGQAIKSFIKNMKAKLTFNLIQLDLFRLEKLLSGTATYTPVAGSPVGVTGEILVANAWEFDTFYPFAHQSGDGTIPTSISATNTGGTPVAGTDYIVTENGGGSGIWGVVIIDTAQTAKTANFVLAYTYTPNASKTLSVGSDSIEIVPRLVRIRKLLATGKYWTAIIYSATNEGGLSFPFPRSDEDNPATMTITMMGSIDTTRTDKDQLFKITDEYGSQSF
jgi:hypothetical protein